jgi:hypothetical protein
MVRMGREHSLKHFIYGISTGINQFLGFHANPPRRPVPMN